VKPFFGAVAKKVSESKTKKKSGTAKSKGRTGSGLPDGIYFQTENSNLGKF
jgi:hypothetical protein